LFALNNICFSCIRNWT